MYVDVGAKETKGVSENPTEPGGRGYNVLLAEWEFQIEWVGTD